MANNVKLESKIATALKNMKTFTFFMIIALITAHGDTKKINNACAEYRNEDPDDPVSVCGTDGVLYKNNYEFQYHKCITQNDDLKVDRFGGCSSDVSNNHFTKYKEIRNLKPELRNLEDNVNSRLDFSDFDSQNNLPPSLDIHDAINRGQDFLNSQNPLVPNGPTLKSSFNDLQGKLLGNNHNFNFEGSQFSPLHNFPNLQRSLFNSYGNEQDIINSLSEGSLQNVQSKLFNNLNPIGINEKFYMPQYIPQQYSNLQSDQFFIPNIQNTADLISSRFENSSVSNDKNIPKHEGPEFFNRQSPKGPINQIPSASLQSQFSDFNNKFGAGTAGTNPLYDHFTNRVMNQLPSYFNGDFSKSLNFLPTAERSVTDTLQNAFPASNYPQLYSSLGNNQPYERFAPPAVIQPDLSNLQFPGMFPNMDYATRDNFPSLANINLPQQIGNYEAIKGSPVLDSLLRQYQGNRDSGISTLQNTNSLIEQYLGGKSSGYPSLEGANSLLEPRIGNYESTNGLPNQYTNPLLQQYLGSNGPELSSPRDVSQYLKNNQGSTVSPSQDVNTMLQQYLGNKYSGTPFSQDSNSLMKQLLGNNQGSSLPDMNTLAQQLVGNKDSGTPFSQDSNSLMKQLLGNSQGFNLSSLPDMNRLAQQFLGNKDSGTPFSQDSNSLMKQLLGNNQGSSISPFQNVNNLLQQLQGSNRESGISPPQNQNSLLQLLGNNKESSNPSVRSQTLSKKQSPENSLIKSNKANQTSVASVPVTRDALSWNETLTADTLKSLPSIETKLDHNVKSSKA